MFQLLGFHRRNCCVGFELRLRPFYPQRIVTQLRRRFGRKAPLPQPLRRFSGEDRRKMRERISLVFSVALLGRYVINGNREIFSDESITLFQERRDHTFYRDGKTIEWMANNPLSVHRPELSGRESEYPFSGNEQEVGYHRLEIRLRSSGKVIGAALLSFLVNSRTRVAKIRILDFGAPSVMGKTLIFFYGFIYAWSSAATIYEIPQSLISQQILRRLPRFLGRAKMQNYFFSSHECDTSDSSVSLKTSLSDGDLGFF